MFRKSFKKGFSLVELLVVITIIAILSVAAYSAVGGNTLKARDAKRKQDIGAIQQALELYYVEKGKYPDMAGTTVAVSPAANGLTKKNLSELPKDPQKKSNGTAINYRYATPGPSNQTYQLATTLEDDGGVMKAYVVGNSETNLIIGVNSSGGSCGIDPADKTTNGSSLCFPYIFD